jgi:beta-xylosidase
MHRRSIAAAVLALVLLAAAGPAGGASFAPAYSGDFPDPAVVRVGGVYWAYSTGSAGRNLQVMSSPDLKAWTAPADPLPALPAWAQRGWTWAPSVIQRGPAFFMYYTARHAASGLQCVSVAVSPVPAGPFTDTSAGPLVCQTERSGSIDPDPYVNALGVPYLLWKSDDNAAGRPTSLWSQQLSGDGFSLVGPRAHLLTADQAWQGGIVEGPAMIASGGVHYLFYGANAWDSPAAGIGFARCASPLGPCVNASTAGPWVGSRGAARGPAGPDLFADGGRVRIAYHAWTGGVGYETGAARSLWVDRVTFFAGQPTLR